MKQYLSASAFARLIGKDPKTVIAWIDKDLIEGAKQIGKRYQIPYEEVEKASAAKSYPVKETWPT